MEAVEARSNTNDSLLAVDAKRIVSEVFPDISLRTWRRLDAIGGVPAGFFVGGRKLWRISDLKLWAEWEFCKRHEFECRLDRLTD